MKLLNCVNCKKKQRILRLTLLCDIPLTNGIVFGLKSICEINNAMHFTFYNLSCVILFEIDSIFKHVIANNISILSRCCLLSWKHLYSQMTMYVTFLCKSRTEKQICPKCRCSKDAASDCPLSVDQSVSVLMSIKFK